MLVIGTHNTIPNSEVETFKVLNFSSFIEGYNKLSKLLPSTSSLRYVDEKQFDADYAKYLLSDYALQDLFKILFPLYFGVDHVYLIISDKEDFIPLNESFIKFIQQRYGYNTSIVNDMDDFEYLKNNSEFSINGITNFDIDRDRFMALYGEEYAAD